MAPGFGPGDISYPVIRLVAEGLNGSVLIAFFGGFGSIPKDGPEAKE
jgi:hypothetical protein